MYFSRALCSLFISYLGFTRIPALVMAATVVTSFPGEKIETQGMKRFTYTDLNVECQSQGPSPDA